MPSADDSRRTLRELIGAARYREALELYERLASNGDPPGSDVKLAAATAATRLGALDRATALATEALAQAGARADSDGRMRASNLLGAIAFERGELDEAERAFSVAVEFARELGDTLLAARAANNLASVAHLRGRPEVALGLYRSALLSYQRLGDRRGAAETWHNLGLCSRHMNDLREADTAALEAVRHAELAGDPALIALAVLGRAEIDLDRRDFELALSQISRAGRSAAESGDPILAAEVRRVRALLAAHQEDFTLARAEADAARTIAEQYGSALLSAECCGVSALAARRLGHHDADLLRTEAVSGLERLGAGRLLDRFNEAWTALN